MRDIMDRIETIVQKDRMSGPCEDDYERTCPYVDIFPDESEHENGSPLDFRNDASKR